MPTFSLPALSNNLFYDGTPVRANDVCVPVLFLVDANGKISSVQGGPIVINDILNPHISGFTVVQTNQTYEFLPSAGTVVDDASGTLRVYHVVTAAPSDSNALSNIVNTFGEGFGFSNVEGYTRGSNLALSDLGLTTSNVFDAGAFREIIEGDSVYSYILVQDPNGRLFEVSQNVGIVEDYTPPTLSNMSVGTIDETTVDIAWDPVYDGGDQAVLADTKVHVGVYASASSPAASDIVNATGAIRTVVVNDGKSTTTLTVGDGSPGNDALDDSTPYHFYSTAEDDNGNLSVVQYLTATTLPEFFVSVLQKFP